MIDLNGEELIPVSRVPDVLPRRPNGKKIHISAVYRWMQKGVHGVRLEYISLGGTRYTSKRALQEFAERLSEPDAPRHVPSPAARNKANARVKDEVERMLYGPQPKSRRESESRS